MFETRFVVGFEGRSETEEDSSALARTENRMSNTYDIFSARSALGFFGRWFWLGPVKLKPYNKAKFRNIRPCRMMAKYVKFNGGETALHPFSFQFVYSNIRFGFDDIREFRISTKYHRKIIIFHSAVVIGEQGKNIRVIISLTLILKQLRRRII